MTGLYLCSSCFLLIFLTILLVRICYYIDWSQSKRYAIFFIGIVQIYILLDALFVCCFLDSSIHTFVFRCIAVLFYLTYVLVPYFWHLFMQSYIGITCGKLRQNLEAIPLLFLLCLILVSVPTGIIWSFSPDGTYIRGPLFSIFAVFNLFYYVFAFVQTFCFLFHKDTGKFRYILKSSIFSAVPLIGILVNTYVIPLYGVYPFQPYCLVVSSLLSYLFMVEHQKNQTESAHREELSSALKLEQEASRKAIAAGKVKNAFLANMSHDIRTPMNAIIGFSNIIARHPEDEEMVRNAISKIQASGDILLRIINDVLDLSRIESGKIDLEESITDLNQMEQRMEMMLEYSLQKGKIHFHYINHMKNPYVWCDATKLQRVLLNVLNNAIKFTPENGSVTLLCEQSPADSNDTASYLFSVKDTGIGMDAEFQKHAFEAFERERTSTESKTEGTGLGLAIVKRLVDMMNGNISINSKPGHGTEIRIIIPLKIAHERPVSSDVPDTADRRDLHGLRTLLVEDNALNAEIAMELLKRMGVQVDWVSDGSSCLERLQNAPNRDYHFILMDIQMPKLNGYDTTRRIRELPDPTLSRIPVIAMTANAFEEDRKQTLAAGMNGFIPKPLDINQVQRVIQDVLFSH